MGGGEIHSHGQFYLTEGLEVLLSGDRLTRVYEAIRAAEPAHFRAHSFPRAALKRGAACRAVSLRHLRNIALGLAKLAADPELCELLRLPNGALLALKQEDICPSLHLSKGAAIRARRDEFGWTRDRASERYAGPSALRPRIFEFLEDGLGEVDGAKLGCRVTLFTAEAISQLLAMSIADLFVVDDTTSAGKALPVELGNRLRRI